jgi:D-alanine-D-alanine ligase
MTKLKVLLAYGGQSSEHDVSVASARNVIKALDYSKYEVAICYIDLSGRWWLQDEVASSIESTIQLLPMLGQKSFLMHPGGDVLNTDVLLPILHGSNGEDGAIQGMAQLVGVRCAGPSLLSAAVTMDKDMTKRLLEREGIPVVPWKTWVVKNKEPTYEVIAGELGHDVFVKPASAGSSVGVSHVTSSESWSEVLQLAAKNSETVLIEKTIYGREIEVAILGNSVPTISAPGEVISGSDFYSYEAKYGSNSNSKISIPADLEKPIKNELTDYALRAYTAVEGKGMARIDFFVTQQGEVFLNEINSIPGFTDISMYPKLWQARDLSATAVVDKLIQLALE